jgi:hypothetical protein
MDDPLDTFLTTHQLQANPDEKIRIVEAVSRASGQDHDMSEGQPWHNESGFNVDVCLLIKFSVILLYSYVLVWL